MLPRIWRLIDENITKRTVMRLLATAWPKETSDYQQLELAYGESFTGHGYDTRDTGERYFRHVLAVVVILFAYLRVRDIDVIIAAFMHDLPEDKPDDWSVEKIASLFNPRAAGFVEAVTKPSKQKYPNRSRRKRATWRKVQQGGYGAILLKLADRLHNMLTLWGNPNRKWSKIYETLEHAMPLAVKHNILIEELTYAISAQMKARHINDERVSEVGNTRTRK